jgi:hypothetical protein
MTTARHHPPSAASRDAAISIRRQVNDEIAQTAHRFDANGGSVFEFLCECGDEACDGHVEMTVAAYRGTVPGSVVGH